MHWRTRRDKGRFCTQAEGRHVHLSTDKVFPCGRARWAASQLFPDESRRTDSRERTIIPRPSRPILIPSRGAPAPSRGSANARSTRCSCSTSIPGPCTRLVSRRLPSSYDTTLFFRSGSIIRGRGRGRGGRQGARDSVADGPPRRSPVKSLVAGRVCSSFMWHSIMTRVTLVQRPGYFRRIMTRGNVLLPIAATRRRGCRAGREVSPLCWWKRPLSRGFFFHFNFRCISAYETLPWPFFVLIFNNST